MRLDEEAEARDLLEQHLILRARGDELMLEVLRRERPRQVWRGSSHMLQALSRAKSMEMEAGSVCKQG